MLNLAAVVVVYAGLIVAAAGALSLARPVRVLGIGSRARAVAVTAAAACLIVGGMLVPAPVLHAETARSDLDRVMTAWQFCERHHLHVRAPASRVYRAFRSVTAEEIWLFRTLTWIRHPRLSTPARETIFAPTPGKPILEVAVNSGFRQLSDTPDREIVLGTMVGRARAAINFRVEPDGGDASNVTTETRVFAPDARSRLAFAAYWRVIYPGSALIRRMWLRAIKRRAEG
jgi:hypothetical protein